MKNEIAAVVLFLSSLIKKNGKLKKEEIERFFNALTKFLHDKYAGHWYPGTPTKEQAYRCIRINKFQGADPELVKACILCGLAYGDLGLPKEITLWVDPWEVCCRYGEKNHAFIVSSFESEDEDKAEISQKVSFVAGNITSDYHSGSSSDEEVYVNSKKGASVMPNTNGSCQIPEFLFQSLPA
ncbi:protein BTG3-like [Bombina bombina]|uniref:protein BTG3-like n=1 Tax=Bombina bombina TaxID=8345 RepID=UPI00235AE96C|nr:protein BTG3-like [Bombina bombina]